MKNTLFGLTIGLLLACVANAGSETPFPGGWNSWNSVSTVLTRIGALPGCDADVSMLPPIYQETVETYCAVRPAGPGAVAVLVKPQVADKFSARSGNYPDGTNLILHLKELKLLFVTDHKDGAVRYGVFKEDGTDVTDENSDSPLSANACRVCHTGYSAFCAYGQCATGQ